MSIQAKYRSIIQSLERQFGPGEAHSLTRNLFEDLFAWRKTDTDRAWSTQEEKQLQRVIRRLRAGEPLQYITGVADFYGLRFKVNPDVLIPRPETEELVAWVLEHEDLFLHPPRILDIGTGSGCIPIVLKKYWPEAEVFALDVSVPAVELARENARSNNLEVNFSVANILDETEWTSLPSFDIIISNPPYIPPSESAVMPLSVIDYEPSLALFVPEHDPLVFYRKITTFATTHLAARGLLFFECNEFNAEQVAALGIASQFSNGTLRRDLQGKWRMWRGRKMIAKE